MGRAGLWSAGADFSAGLLAETKGFEPLVPDGTAVFKTAAFDHSATSPRGDVAENVGWVKPLDGKARATNFGSRICSAHRFFRPWPPGFRH